MIPTTADPNSDRSRPVTVAMLLQNLEYGGTQRYVVNLVSRLDRRLIQPEVWVLEGIKDMAPLIEAAGVPIVWLSQTAGVTPASLWRLLTRLLRCPPDVLYTLTTVPNIWGRIFGRLTGVPAIISSCRTWVPRQLERFLWPFSHRLICNSAVLKESMIKRFGVAPERVVVIPNGVDTEYFQPAWNLRAPEPTILYLGRLHPAKDPLTMLKAFRIVIQCRPEARLDLVGYGPLQDQVASFLATNGLRQKVNCTPGTEDVRSFLARAWVLALPSAWEGSPNVVLEAMAMGVPVVATKVAGVPELVDDSRTGLLVPPRQPEALARSLLEVLDHDDRRRAMGQAAKEAIQTKHDLNLTVRQTAEVILDVAQRRNVF